MSDAREPMKAGQPFPYPPKREYVEPDWTRIPGYRTVSAADWENATWQRKHTIKNCGSSGTPWDITFPWTWPRASPGTWSSAPPCPC